jgi:5'-nucleotidase
VSPTAGALTSNNTVCPPAPAFCDQAVVDMLVPYRQQLSAILDGTIGTSAGTFPGRNAPPNIERSGEIALGDLIADGQKWRYGTQLGYMNGGGIRAALPTGYLPADHTLRRPAAGYASGPPWDLVTGDVYTVLPFNNVISTRSVTGDQLWAMLENSVSKIGATGVGTDGRFGHISGFKFTFRYDVPTGCTGSQTATPVTWECNTTARVTAVSLTDGTPILPDSTTYTVALPNFVNAGGDGYTMLNDGQGVSRELDAAVMLAYVEFLGGDLDPADFPLDRITKLP